MTDQLCGVCRQPVGEVAGYWCAEPVDSDCKDKLLAAGYNVVVE